MSLEKRTKNDIDTDKKPKIYFTCHPDDFEMCFDKICEDIFRTHDCVIFYKKDMSVAVPEKERELDLARNNLFVIPVTERLLTSDNCTMSQELPYAIRKGIPVLPILMEEVSDELYSSADNFGDLQYLNAVAKDDTAIAYEKKLKKYLESVLISSEFANRIRAAFDAYIFLSYRKMDRRYANDLMRLIHSNPECRDIAIWFDEFLTPGESFKDNIEKILDDCELFTLLVTPHLLEKVIDENGEIKDNFVISIELPKARENKEKKGTDILAVEMVDTDKAALHGISIDDCVNVRDEAAFRERLLDAVSKIALRENDNDPEHNFLIGLAYLEGIDVEVDRRRAAALIEGAAEDGLPEAMARLIIMHSNGVDDARSKDKVNYWSKRLADNYFEQIFSENGSIKSKEKIIELARFYEDIKFEGVFRSFLLRIDTEISADILKPFFDAFLTEGITEYTLLFEALEWMKTHKKAVGIILTKDILLKSANGVYPPYGPLFWYVPEYGLYEELLIALDSIKESKAFTNALALTRDVCRIFGHFNEITEITKDIDGRTLLCNAQLSGVRKGLCELFFTGSTDCTEGLDIYPRCFNVCEAKSWKETGCGIHGRMPVSFEDELGLYSHESFTELHGEYIGIVSVPYDRELIESKLNTKSCKKLCGLFLSPTENKEIKDLAINDRYIKEIYIPENSEYYKKWRNLSKNAAVSDDGIIYFDDKVALPYCMTRVAAGAFSDCSSLQAIILHDGITEIGEYAFYGCSSLESINLPGGITKIGWRAFCGCSSLTSITLPDGIIEIGEYVFGGCSSLKTINLPRDITKIGEYAFRGCRSLPSIILPYGMTKIDECAFSGCSSLTSIILPDGITEIGELAFSGCTSLISITLPDGITKIGEYAFKNCSSLTSIILPDGITEIGELAFSGCTSLISITLPDGITRIGDYAFYGCTLLTSINLADSITEIGESAFGGCNLLKSVNLPDGITKIGWWTFSGCSSLKSINFPQNITKIGVEAFRWCSSLTSITIPASVRILGDDAFKGCTGLREITISRRFEDELPKIFSDVDLSQLTINWI